MIIWLKISGRSGQLLIEVLVIMGLLAVILPALVGSLVISRQGEPQRQNRLNATLLLREGVDYLRLIREESWLDVQEPGTYQLVQSGTSWSLDPGIEQVGGFERFIEIESVFRDEVGEIAPSGEEDLSIRRVRITVRWDDPSPGEISSLLYLTRYLDNITFVDSLEQDFALGDEQGTEVVTLVDGDVILAESGNADWCNPTQHIVAELNLPQSGRARAVAAIEGKAFTGTNSLWPSGAFFEIDITNDEVPSFSISNTVAGAPTNDVFIDEQYAYIATQDIINWNGHDVIIVDLSTGQQVGYFDVPSWVGGNGIYVKDNVGYVTTGNWLRTFDLSQKTGERPQMSARRIEEGFLLNGWYDLVVRGQKVRVVGDYAFVAIRNSSYQMRLFNISNPNNISRGARVTIGGNGQELFVNDAGTRAYLATDQDQFRVINTDYSTSQKNSSSFNLQPLGSYDTQGMSPRGVVAVSSGRALLVGVGGEEYQVLDISDESNIVRCGGMQIDSGVYGVAGVLEDDGDAYSYIVTEDPNNEFKAILGGPGGGVFLEDGIFESRIFDAGHTTAFNYSIAQFQRPTNTTAQYQISIANPADGNCATADYAFIGPDGSASSFYDDEGPIFWGSTSGEYANPGRCFRYRIYFSTTDTNVTPVLESMTINYSP